MLWESWEDEGISKGGSFHLGQLPKAWIPTSWVLLELPWENGLWIEPQSPIFFLWFALWCLSDASVRELLIPHISVGLVRDDGHGDFRWQCPGQLIGPKIKSIEGSPHLSSEWRQLGGKFYRQSGISLSKRQQHFSPGSSSQLLGKATILKLPPKTNIQSEQNKIKASLKINLL